MKRVLKTIIAFSLVFCMVLLYRPVTASAAATTWKVTWDKSSKAWYSSADGGKSWSVLDSKLPLMQDGAVLIIDGDNSSKGMLRLELTAKVGELCVMGGATASVKSTKGFSLAYAITGNNTLIVDGNADEINVNYNSVIQVLGNVGKVNFVYDNANTALKFGIDGTVGEATVHVGNRWNNTTIYDVAAGKLELTEENVLKTPAQYYSLNPSKPQGKTDKSASSTVTVKVTNDASVNIYRLYNPLTGEHFFTSNANEIDGLVKLGWNDEGVAFKVAAKSDTPVYRYFNTKTGEHLYTTSSDKTGLSASNYSYEGIAWYSSDSTGSTVYRLRPAGKKDGYAHYTSSTVERDTLVKAGWTSEAAGFYAK